jgi:hypothetical protein
MKKLTDEEKKWNKFRKKLDDLIYSEEDRNAVAHCLICALAQMCVITADEDAVYDHARQYIKRFDEMVSFLMEDIN